MGRTRPDWLTVGDEMMLDRLSDAGLAITPQALAIEISMNRDHVNRRLTELVDAGLVEKHPDKPLYETSVSAEQWLAGEIDLPDDRE